jgi:hypothetical protein
MIREIKRSSVFKTLIDQIQHLQIKFLYDWNLKHQFMMRIYFPIRNFEYAIADKEFGKHAEHKKQTYWKLRDPLKIKTVVSTGYKYCPSCHLLDENLVREIEDLEHATLRRFYERYLWSSKYQYKYTRGECEDLIFEPLETWYGSGGEEGSSTFTRPDAYWYYTKPKQYTSREEARSLCL